MCTCTHKHETSAFIYLKIFDLLSQQGSDFTVKVIISLLWSIYTKLSNIINNNSGKQNKIILFYSTNQAFWMSFMWLWINICAFSYQLKLKILKIIKIIIYHGINHLPQLEHFHHVKMHLYLVTSLFHQKTHQKHLPLFCMVTHHILHA